MKRSPLIHLSFLFLIFIISCSAPLDQDSGPLVGKWSIEQVFEDSANVTGQLNPENDRYFLFHKDGSFYTDGTPYGRDGGEWLMKEDTLYLENDPIGGGDDSFWVIDFQGDSMIWMGMHSAVTERYKMTLRRKNNKLPN